jgi:hypothetical protein
VLLKVGETEQKIGQAQLEFSGRVKEGLVKSLEDYMNEMKTYKVTSVLNYLALTLLGAER